MNVLLLGGGLQALSVADSLRNCGYDVAVFSDDKTALNSKMITRKFNHSADDFEALYKTLSEISFDAIIPMGDSSALFLSNNKEYIEREFRTKCIVPDLDVFSLVHNKSSFMMFCQKNDIPHPRTSDLNKDSMRSAADYVGFPAMLKPDISVGARGITKVNNYEDLISNFDEVSKKYGACSLQEYVDNKEYYYSVVMYRDVNGLITNHTIIKIVRFYPVGGGSSSCAISIDDDRIFKVCKKTLDKLNWHGLANFDILEDKKTKELKIIEINPRVPASLRAAAVSNVNFPDIMLSDHLGKPIKEYEYQAGKILRYLGIDILWFLKSKKRFSSSPSWFSFFGKDIYYQDIYKQDSSTWLSWLTVGLRKLFRA